MPTKKHDKGETKSADRAQENVANVSRQTETQEAPKIEYPIQKSQTPTGLAQSFQSRGEGGYGESSLLPPRTINTNTTMRRTATEVTDDLPSGW